MKRTTVFIEEDVERELRLAAEKRGVPAASVLREALDQYFRKGRNARHPAPRFLAAGRSGTQTTAERHEELLFKDLEPHRETRKRRRRPARNR